MCKDIEIHGNANLLIYGHIYHLYLFIEYNVIMIHLKNRAHLIYNRRDSDGYVWISTQKTQVEIRRAQQVKITEEKYLFCFVFPQNATSTVTPVREGGGCQGGSNSSLGGPGLSWASRPGGRRYE